MGVTEKASQGVGIYEHQKGCCGDTSFSLSLKGQTQVKHTPKLLSLRQELSCLTYTILIKH